MRESTAGGAGSPPAPAGPREEREGRGRGKGAMATMELARRRAAAERAAREEKAARTEAYHRDRLAALEGATAGGLQRRREQGQRLAEERKAQTLRRQADRQRENARPAGDWPLMPAEEAERAGAAQTKREKMLSYRQELEEQIAQKQMLKVLDQHREREEGLKRAILAEETLIRSRVEAAQRRTSSRAPSLAGSYR